MQIEEKLGFLTLLIGKEIEEIRFFKLSVGYIEFINKYPSEVDHKILLVEHTSNILDMMSQEYKQTLLEYFNNHTALQDYILSRIMITVFSDIRSMNMKYQNTKM